MQPRAWHNLKSIILCRKIDNRPSERTRDIGSVDVHGISTLTGRQQRIASMESQLSVDQENSEQIINKLFISEIAMVNTPRSSAAPEDYNPNDDEDDEYEDGDYEEDDYDEDRARIESKDVESR
jgi:hypothetical protein